MEPDNDVWELYNLEEDWGQANDLASKMPEKLAQLKDIFLIEAVKNKALIGGGLWVAALHSEMRIQPHIRSRTCRKPTFEALRNSFRI
jgi:hypothetical protein